MNRIILQLVFYVAVSSSIRPPRPEVVVTEPNSLRPTTSANSTSWPNGTHCEDVRCPFGRHCELNENNQASCVCDENCYYYYNPVCGSDNRTYSDNCELTREACRTNSNLSIIYYGQCQNEGSICVGITCPSNRVCAVAGDRATCVCSPEDCPTYSSPVCGSDNQTYINDCELRRHSCMTNDNITIANYSECEQATACDEVSCPTGIKCAIDERHKPVCVCGVENCPYSTDIVCGSDGRTYGSECELLKKACTSAKNVRVTHKGYCLEGSVCDGHSCPPNKQCNVNQYNEPVCSCNQSCPYDDSPVCGSDGVTYTSLCQLKIQACTVGTNLTLARTGKCVYDEYCNGVMCQWPMSCVVDTENQTSCVCSNKCDDYYYPVCGSDNKTYDNFCQLNYVACQGNISTDFYYGVCSEGSNCQGIYYCGDGKHCDSEHQPEPKCVCNTVCPKTYSPICGSNNETYNNSCELQQDACFTNTSISQQFNGRCDEGPGCSYTYCPYGRTCVVDEWNRPHCVCSQLCSGGYTEACGSDGKTYSSDCFLAVAACMTNKTITLQSYSPCKEDNPCSGVVCSSNRYCDVDPRGRSVCVCNEECPNYGYPVCGSDNRTYSSYCELRKQACLSGSGTLWLYYGSCVEVSACDRASCPPDKRCAIDELNQPVCVCIEECLSVQYPVCGSDRRTYINECELQKKACLSNINATLAHRGKCDQGMSCSDLPCPAGRICALDEMNRPTCVCNTVCSDSYYYNPICGTDGKTYSSDCYLQREACTTDTNLKTDYIGACRSVVVMSDPIVDVVDIGMEHHDPEEVVADLPLSLESVLQLSVEQLRDKLLELGVDSKGMQKPQLQLELLRVLGIELAVPESKPATVDQDQLQLQREQLQLEMLRLKFKTEADMADRKERLEKQEAEIELQERKDKMEQQRFTAELEAQLRKEAFEAELRKEAAEQQRRREDFEQQERERKEVLEAQLRREMAEATERKERKEAQEAKERLELESQLKDKQIRADLEKQHIEAALQREKLAAEDKKQEADAALQRKKLAAEDKKLQAETALQREKLQADEREQLRQHTERQLRIERGVPVTDTVRADGFRLSSAVKFVPRFQDNQMDVYLIAFEKCMLVHHFPKDAWTQLIHTQLNGKALKVFAELSVEECMDFEILKRALLLAYDRVPEFHRKRFRTLSKANGKSYSNFAFRLALPFKSWMDGEEAYDNVDRMREVVKLEQFVNCLPLELHRWVVERKPRTVVDAARLADEYAVLYKPFKLEQASNQKLEHVSVPPNDRGHSFHNSRARGRFTQRAHLRGFSHNVRCARCSRHGHIASNCQTILPYVSPNLDAVHTVGLVTTNQNLSCRSRLSKVHDSYTPYCATATYRTNNGERRDIVYLRDSGSLQTLASKQCFSEGDYVDTSEHRLIQGIFGIPTEIPLVEIDFQNDKLQGKILCGLVDSLPYGVDLLVGNDLEGIMPLTVNVVTRAGTDTSNTQNVVRPVNNNVQDIGSDFDDVDDNEMNVLNDVDVAHNITTTRSAPVNQDDDFASDLDRLFTVDVPPVIPTDEIVTRMQLIEMQHADVSLHKLFVLAKSPHSITDVTYYETRSDVLVRCSRDKFSPAGLQVTQIVVPQLLRAKLLHIAHDLPTSGHLGIKKTYDRLARHFFWLGMRSSVVEYCRTCETCQRLGKLNMQHRAPLINLPVIGDIFSRIAIDIVGPLKTCASGCRFILTVIDFASHYPLAFALKNHTAMEVVRCLIEVFTQYGFPDELLSDCGTEFLSELTQLFLLEIQVWQMKTSPYHPQTNGCLERFHRTLKGMLKGCLETYEGDWDLLLPWVLFAYREVPVKGLGFSPFELVFGRNVKGVLQLIKKSWLDSNNLDHVKSVNVIEYILSLRDRIRNSLEIVNDLEEKVKKKSKVWYDRKAREVSYDVGDQVLLLLPLVGKPLQAKYSGPYIVEKRLGEVDYVICTPDRRKSRRTVHANLMRRFIPRDTPPVLPVAVVGVNASVQALREDKFAGLKLDHLQPQQRAQLLSLLDGFRVVFDERPGKTTVVQHRIDLVPNARPVKQAPYRLHPDKLRSVNSQIESLLAEGIIEESTSAWAAPILVVPKPDGTGRLCVDFRRLNAVTVPDPFPMPRIDVLLDRLGGAVFMTKLDMTKAYFQVPVAPEHVHLTGFVTSQGHWQWRYMAFGLRNAPATFSRLVDKIFKGLEDYCEAYLDDVMVFSRSWDDHLTHLHNVFVRVQLANLTLNIRKCEFANATLDFLGHTLSLNTVRPRQQKVDALLNFPTPTNRKQVQSLLGLAGYYGKFLPHYADITLPLTKLLKKNQQFKWSDAADAAFLDLKSRLASRPILKPPNYDLPFCMAVDASDNCLGAVLFQVIDGLEHPICYLSRKLRSAELNYATIEKEALALVTAVRAFSVYFGASMVIVYTDHCPLKYIQTMQNKNQKLCRWALELQQFSLNVQHRAGKDNLLPDLLSRPSTTIST